MKDQPKIRSLSEFLDAVYKRINFSDEEENSQILWFRGESSNQWSTPLVPSIYGVLADTLKVTKNDWNPE